MGKSGSWGAGTDALSPLGSTHDPKISLPAIPSESSCRERILSLLPPCCKKFSPHLSSILPSSLLLPWYSRRGSRDMPETLQEPDEMVADPSSTDLSGLGVFGSSAAPQQLLLIALAVNQQVPHQHRLSMVSWREQWLWLLSASVLG